MNMEDKLDRYFNNNIEPKLNELSKIKLRNYSQYDAHDLNKYLLGHGQSIGVYDSTIELIRNSIKLSRLPFPITIYHGTSNKILNGHILDNDHQFSIKIKSLFSCTLNKDTASVFMPLSNASLPNIMFEVNLPTNYPALWMRSLSLHSNENELLLLNNTKLDIISSQDEIINGNCYTLLRTIPHIK